MSDFNPALSQRATELREAFDRSFAVPAVTEPHDTINFIGIRLAEDSYAIRLSEIAGLHAGITIVPCPSRAPELLGIAAFRGALTPVYDLAALLGYPASLGRWVVLAQDGKIAFAFAEFDGHLGFEPSEVAANQTLGDRPYIVETAHKADRAWPIIDFPSLVAAIRKQLRLTSAIKE